MRSALRLLSQVAHEAASASPYTSGRRGSKITTGIHGLPIHPSPAPALIQVYSATLDSLASKIPSGVVYRQSAEAITNHRLAVVKKHAGQDGNQGGEQAIEAIEKDLGVGVIEEVLRMAEGEQVLVDKMAEWKA